MKAVFEIINEQIVNLNLIFRMAIYNMKSKYQSHYLGIAWQFINPTIQILIYWFVFGIGIRSGKPMGDIPFVIWLMVGLIPWFFINSSITQGSNSVYTKVSLVSKMKFPVSVLPSITILGNAFNFIFMLVILSVILIIYQINPGIYFIQIFYYLFCLIAFLFSTTLLFSTISTIVRDFQMIIQSFMRMAMYVSGVLWNINDLPDQMATILKLNPLYYLVDGFRKTLLYQEWFFVDWVYMIYFWSLTLVTLVIGALIHIRFRKHFVDYI